jgi:cardiolipin synthase C
MKNLSLAFLTATLLLNGNHPAFADEVKYVKRADEALASFLSVINGAKKTLDLTTFILEPCHASTQVLLDAMAAKSRQGVKVRVLLDSFMQEGEQRAYLGRFFADNGIEFRWYNDAGSYNPDTNMRTHVKLLVADGKRYVSGGRNWADDYFGLYRGINFTDSDLLVNGKSGAAAAASFQEMWAARQTSVAKEMSAPFASWGRVCATDETARVASVKKFLAKESARLLAEMPARACPAVSFVTDSPLFSHPSLTGGIDRRWDNYMGTMRLSYKRTSKGFLDFANGTKKGLEIENWSYIPVNYVQKAFDDLRAKNIPVHVITNADMDGPGIIKHAEEYANNTMVARHNRGSQTIIQLSPYGGMDDSHPLTPKDSPFRIHSKVAVRDGRDVFVGSFNIDPRSYSTNLESAVEVANCPALAKDIEGEFDYLRKTYVDDVKSGRIPAQEPPSFLAKILGIIGINFL